jgi:starch-binding outer membrane protein, SusD/RagB family
MNRASRQPLLLGTALMFLAAGTLFGCRESFLTDAAAAQGTLDQTVLANAAGVEGNLIAAYRSLDYTTSVGSQSSAPSNWIWGSVTSDDAYKGTEPTDFTSINDIEGYHWSTAATSGELNNKWRSMYEGINRANSTIRLLKQVAAEKPTELTPDQQAGIEGEATFLRAFYYFELYRMFGNVPYLRDDDTDVRKASEDQAAVAADIMTDLDKAISLLPATPRNGQVGRATSWTATAFKGKLQMYLQDFAGAEGTFNTVVASGVYALEDSYDKVWTGFKSFENGKETIFAFQASANDGEPSGNNANYGERLNFPHSGSPFGCCGFHQASQNLANSFRTDPVTGLPTIMTNSATWNADNSDMTGKYTALMSLDPRIDWTMGRNDVPFKDWGMHDSTWIRNIPNGGTYSAKKNVHEKASGAQSSVGWVNTQLNSVNIHILRYADVLLMLAEAEVELNKLPEAMALVNQVRTRAGAKAQGCGLPTDANAAAAEVATWPQCANDARLAVPINDPSIGWAKYKVGLYTSFPDQTYARDAVRTERKLELAMEGHRFFDLRRYGSTVFETTLNDYINGVGGGKERDRRSYLQTADPVTDRHMLYPIPQIQVQLSTVDGEVRVPQNPGW